MSPQSDTRSSRRPPKRVAIAAGALALMLLPLAAQAQAQEWDYACRFGEAQRRVQVQQGERPDGLPCRVLYFKGGREQVLWRADSSAGFCRDKALELVDSLKQAGWTCTGDAPGAPEVTRAASRDGGDARAAPGGAPGGVAMPAPRPPRAQPPDAPPAAANRAEFDRAVRRDLERLNATGPRSGAFEARRGTLGDLDGDGVSEAAIIIAYGSNARAVQFLLLYRFDGETFVPVAKTGLGQPERVGPGEVERIERDAIRVRLLVFQPDDPPCCPTGERRVVFGLHDGQLVEVSTERLADRGQPAIP